MPSRNIVPCIPARGRCAGLREMEGFQQKLGDGSDSLLVIRVCPMRDVPIGIKARVSFVVNLRGCQFSNTENVDGGAGHEQDSSVCLCLVGPLAFKKTVW